MSLDPSPAAAEFAWTGRGPGPDSTLEVRRQAAGLWHVTYEGLIWATSDSLRVALEDACGVPKNEPWAIETEKEILAHVTA